VGLRKEDVKKRESIDEKGKKQAKGGEVIKALREKLASRKKGREQTSIGGKICGQKGTA